jgi:hypothetical protein
VPNDIKVNTNSQFAFKGGWNLSLYTWTESFMYPADLYSSLYVERRDDAGAVTDTVAYAGTHRLPNLGAFINIARRGFGSFLPMRSSSAAAMSTMTSGRRRGSCSRP